MPNAEEARRQAVVLRHLQAMGLEAHAQAGGHCVIARLRLRGAPFESPWGNLRIGVVTLATLGADAVKCLSPLPLAYLPALPILECSSADAVEVRIRTAWRARVAVLEQTRRWLEKLGVGAEIAPAAPFLSFPLDVEDAQAQAAAIEPGRIILPSRGPLRGITLRRAEDRVFADPGCSSAVDIEIAVTTRLEELARLDARLAQAERMRLALHRDASGTATAARRRLLLVGPRLATDTPLIESLHLRGYQVSRARSVPEALRRFQETSHELVLVDTQLDRGDGLELIPVLRAVPGLEEIPVVMVDEHFRSERRQAARRMGAVGYLVRPILLDKIEQGVAQLVRTPRRRRFTRYPRRLSVHWPGSHSPGITSSLGRGGMLLWSDRDAVVRRVDRYAITLPEIGEKLRVDAEVAYRISAVGASRVGFGLRFVGFPDGNEDALIALLQSLEPLPPPA